MRLWLWSIVEVAKEVIVSRVTLYKQKKGKKKLPTWWIYYRRDGKTFRESTNTADREEAAATQKQIERLLAFDRREELTEGFYRATRDLDTKETPMKEFFDQVRATVISPKTFSRYKGIDENFLSFIKEHFPKISLLHEIKPTHVQAWHRNILERGLKPRTVNLNLKILRIAFNKAVKTGLILKDPTDPIELLKVPESARRPFTVEELNMIFSKAEGFFRYSGVLALYTGARLGDIVCLKWRDIDFRHGNITFKMQKRRGKPMEIPMYPGLRALLLELRGNKQPNPNDYLFPKEAVRYQESGSSPISTMWLNFLGKLKLIEHSRSFYDKRVKAKKAGKKVKPLKRKPGELSFHSFRHTAISLLKNIGAPEAVAMQIAGHESASISKIYTHLDEGAERRWIEAMPDYTRPALGPAEK